MKQKASLSSQLPNCESGGSLKNTKVYKRKNCKLEIFLHRHRCPCSCSSSEFRQKQVCLRCAQFADLNCPLLFVTEFMMLRAPHSFRRGILAFCTKGGPPFSFFPALRSQSHVTGCLFSFCLFVFFFVFASIQPRYNILPF